MKKSNLALKRDVKNAAHFRRPLALRWMDAARSN
jgi:hypothetical protein